MNVAPLMPRGMLKSHSPDQDDEWGRSLCESWVRAGWACNPRKEVVPGVGVAVSAYCLEQGIGRERLREVASSREEKEETSKLTQPC